MANEEEGKEEKKGFKMPKFFGRKRPDIGGAKGFTPLELEAAKGKAANPKGVESFTGLEEVESVKSTEPIIPIRGTVPDPNSERGNAADLEGIKQIFGYVTEENLPQEKSNGKPPVRSSGNVVPGLGDLFLGTEAPLSSGDDSSEEVKLSNYINPMVEPDTMESREGAQVTAPKFAKIGKQTELFTNQARAAPRAAAAAAAAAQAAAAKPSLQKRKGNRRGV